MIPKIRGPLVTFELEKKYMAKGRWQRKKPWLYTLFGAVTISYENIMIHDIMRIGYNIFNIAFVPYEHNTYLCTSF